MQNGEQRAARTVQSGVTNHVKLMQTRTNRYQKKIDQGNQRYQAKLEGAQQKLAGLKSEETSAIKQLNKWRDLAFWTMLAIIALLIIDALRLPKLKKWAQINAPLETELASRR